MGDELLKAIAVVAEVTGTELSKGALILIEKELKRYPGEVAMAALGRTARECTGRLSLAQILSRIDDGRPGADEAWTMVPMDEDTTTVWNNEICEAWDCCRDLICSGDTIAARMAFKSAYERIAQRNKNDGMAPGWTVSLGFDKNGRAEPIRKAVQLGRLPATVANNLLPPGHDRDEILQIKAPERAKLIGS